MKSIVFDKNKILENNKHINRVIVREFQEAKAQLVKAGVYRETKFNVSHPFDLKKPL